MLFPFPSYIIWVKKMADLIGIEKVYKKNENLKVGIQQMLSSQTSKPSVVLRKSGTEAQIPNRSPSQCKRLPFY